jgi:hypothetical protein
VQITGIRGQTFVRTEDSGTPEQFKLSTLEMFALHALRRQMMRTDLRNETNAKARKRKRDTIRRHHSEFLATIGSVDDESLIAHVDITDAAKRLAGRIDKRSRAMILLVDLMTFNPWHPEDKWVPTARKEALKAAADELAGVSTEDLAAATKEFDALFKELRQKSIKWGRVAAIGIVGAAVGVATGGLAAPYIGGMIGASMGLSGAAATSAGLAALGGGALAAGGFGVFGGTILVGGVGGVVAGGAAGAATRYSPAGAGEVILARIFRPGGVRRLDAVKVVEQLCFSIWGVFGLSVSPGWAGVPGAGVFRVGRGQGWSGGQGKAARRRCQAVAMAPAQRQVASMRSRSWRAPRVMRAATCRTR